MKMSRLIIRPRPVLLNAFRGEGRPAFGGRVRNVSAEGATDI
jgi:hypothetical protein